MAFRLSHLFSKNPANTDGLEQAEREAIIDLLHFAMYADKSLSQAEDKYIDGFIETLSWESGVSPELYVNRSIADARNVLGNEAAAADFLGSLKTRLPRREARAKALNLLSALLQSDGISDQESSLYGQVKLALQ